MADDYTSLMAAAVEAAGVHAPIVQPVDHHVVLNGLNFHYLDWGNEHLPHLVMLHGGSLTAHTFDMAALLLRDRYHLVVLDQRGHGDSDWTPQVTDDTGALMVQDVRAFLDHLGYERLVLLGMSMGGINTLRYAAESPQRLRAIVVVDVGPELMREGAIEMEQFAQQTETLARFEDFLERAVHFNPDRPEAHLRYSLTHALKRTAEGWTWKNDRRPRPQVDEEQAQAARERMADELWAAVHGIVLPTLLLRGERSKILSADAAQRMVEAMPHARCVEIARAGHTVHGDNPIDFATAVGEFLDRLP